MREWPSEKAPTYAELRAEVARLEHDAHNLKSPTHAICNQNLTETLTAALEEKQRADRAEAALAKMDALNAFYGERFIQESRRADRDGMPSLASESQWECATKSQIEITNAVRERLTICESAMAAKEEADCQANDYVLKLCRDALGTMAVHGYVEGIERVVKLLAANQLEEMREIAHTSSPEKASNS
jgi:hypothetical protein